MERLWTLETINRLNFVTAYLVLLAGTGSDHQLTKWSAKAIEEYVGIGKPRGQKAIEELIGHGVISRTETSTRFQPQYRLPLLERESDPIFLPVQLITGLASETPVLRRIRQAGDPLLLRMLVDLYSLVQIDVTHGVPLANLRTMPPSDVPAIGLFDMGANSVWAIEAGNTQQGGGDWTKIHHTSGKEAWTPFWDRVGTLLSIGAIAYEFWVFDSDSKDAEPLFPVNIHDPYGVSPSNELRKPSSAAFMAAASMAGERTYYLQRAEGKILVPLTRHHQAPAIQGVAKLRVEADTPGRRRAYAMRMNTIEAYDAAYLTLATDSEQGNYSRPLSLQFKTVEGES